MKEKFSDNTHQYIRELACEKPTKEKERKTAIVKHTEEKIEIKEVNKKKRAAQATKLADRVAKVKLIFDKKKVDRLRGDDLRDLLRVFKKAGAPNVQKMKIGAKVGEIKDGINQAIDLFNAKKWKPSYEHVASVAQENSSGEDFNFSDPDSSDEGSNWETEDEVNNK